MPVLLNQDLPARREDVEAVSAALGIKENPPDGLILHAFTETAEGVHVTDVWESAAHYDKFRDERLLPTMGKVMAERGVSIDGPPPVPHFADAFDVVTGHRH